jgi:hypothetical protein
MAIELVRKFLKALFADHEDLQVWRGQRRVEGDPA